MLYRILGAIYLSSLEPLTSGEDLKAKYGITHILSVLPGTIPSQYTENYIHKQIEVTDEESSNILQFLPETNSFIEAALFPPAVSTSRFQSGPNAPPNKILVHCAQGVSRSPTVIMAYLLQKYRLTFEQALHALKRKNPAVEPNDSFINQIKLFKKMLDLKLDQSSKLYRQFLVEITLLQDPTGESLKELNLFKKNALLIHNTSPSTINYRCKRCRHVLATNHNVEYHDQPTEDSHQSKFIKRGHTNRIISVEQGSTTCSHHFLSEPLDWMMAELDKSELEGKFNCPNDKCGAKIGAYSWRGSRCSCGKWVIPAFHLQSNKVDEVKVLERAPNVPTSI